MLYTHTFLPDNQEARLPLGPNVRALTVQAGFTHIRTAGYATPVRMRAVKGIGRTIGRPDICVHSLRHTFATLCRNVEEVSLSEVGRELGHSSESTTRIYDHPSTDRQKKLADRLPSIVFEIA